MRRKDREVTDIQEILHIVDEAKILHLGLMDEGYPYIVPMHYGYEFADETFVFYLHSAKEGHKLNLIRKDAHVCLELETNVELVSGGKVPCMYGAAFASVIGKGTAEVVEEEPEKIKALELLMKNQTGRAFEITGKMAESVEVIRVTVKEFTAKRRAVPAK